MTAKLSFKENPHSWYIIAAVMLSTIMEILDTTIVNVSLPHMMGSLSADRTQISWVLTSYIVASGTLMPLTGFLVGRFGSRQLLLINIVGFMFASALCGLSSSLWEIVLFRLLQGVFGASLVPLSQFILRDTFSTADQPKVMAMWGIGVMSAPIFGPTLGGYLTDALNWRWVFYINVPVCIINFFLVLGFIKESPLKKGIIDWTGMILMLVAIASLQLFLDRGSIEDWFASAIICWLFASFLIAALLFFIHSSRAEHPIINLKLFKDRNFAASTLLITFFGATVLGSLTLLPQMLETLFGYTADVAGLAMAPRGVASALMMGLAAQLIRHFDPRWLIAGGLCASAYTTWFLSNLTLNASMEYFILIGLIQGVGIGSFFMPLTTISYATLPSHSIAEASGLFSFGRSIGNAIGISLLTTLLERDAQANWNVLGGHLRAGSEALTHWLYIHHLSLNNPHTIALLGRNLAVQANFIAFAHTFHVAAIVLFAAVFLIFLLKAPPKGAHLTIDVH